MEETVSFSDWEKIDLRVAEILEVEEIKDQGSMIIFPSFLDHCVTPITKGTRYSLVLWSVGDPFK